MSPIQVLDIRLTVYCRNIWAPNRQPGMIDVITERYGISIDFTRFSNHRRLRLETKRPLQQLRQDLLRPTSLQGTILNLRMG